MHTAMVTAALLAMALGTTGCMHGFGALNAMTALMLGMPVPAQGDAVTSNDSTTVYVNNTNTTYVTNNNTYVSGSSSTGSSRASRPHRSHRRY